MRSVCHMEVARKIGGAISIVGGGTPWHCTHQGTRHSRGCTGRRGASCPLWVGVLVLQASKRTSHTSTSWTCLVAGAGLTCMQTTSLTRFSCNRMTWGGRTPSHNTRVRQPHTWGGASGPAVSLPIIASLPIELPKMHLELPLSAVLSLTHLHGHAPTSKPSETHGETAKARPPCAHPSTCL